MSCKYWALSFNCGSLLLDFECISCVKVYCGSYCNCGSLANDRVLHFECGSLSSKRGPFLIIMGLSISHASKRVLSFECGSLSSKMDHILKLWVSQLVSERVLSFEKWALNIIFGLSPCQRRGLHF